METTITTETIRARIEAINGEQDELNARANMLETEFNQVRGRFAQAMQAVHIKHAENIGALKTLSELLEASRGVAESAPE
jgi:predicted nuclease with TOPRIM domain